MLGAVAAFSFVQGWLDREQEARIDNAFEIANLSANISQAVGNSKAPRHAARQSIAAWRKAGDCDSFDSESRFVVEIAK
jgi:hypothetical protein